MLRIKDLKIETGVNQRCYLTHRSRSEELDDILIDAANQIFLDRKDLKRWTTSAKSAEFLDTFHGLDIDARDFITELKMACDDGLISLPKYGGVSNDRQKEGA